MGKLAVNKYAVALTTLGMALATSSAQAGLTSIGTTSADGNPPGNLTAVMRTLTGISSYNAMDPANRVDDSADQVWTGQSGGGVISTLILEIAGNRNGNSFGIYNLGDVSQRVQVFPGSANGVTAPVTVAVPTSWGGSFGFYLANGGTTFYSRQSDNGGADNMVTLKNSGPGNLTLNTSAFVSGGWASGGSVSWSPGEYLLGWEDLRIGGGAEPDYQDMLVKVNAVPVPEPTTMIAGVLLLLPFAASSLRILRRKH